ncbi:MAG: alkaline phosphatase family protein [Chloroflexi bacterium]|nr:alkaline phosphatase family protein [Chloroflexota bacterium]
MTDLTPDLLPKIKAHRLPNLDLGDGFVYPNYDGDSILNIPSSICRLLGAPEFGASGLREEILVPLGKNIRRVILVLMDALALHRLQRWIAAGDLPVWESLLAQGLLAPITSITPSTTSAALTTLWTGRPALEHGILGYELWLKEYGIVTNMISHKPITYRGQGGNLSSAGFDPETFLPAPESGYSTLGAHLVAHDIGAYAFQHYSIVRSGLSRMFFSEVNVHPFSTPADLWISVRQLLESRLEERLYAWVYWGAVDGLSHIHGPDNERSAAEFAHFSAVFERNFLSLLSADARKDTVVILCADHGQITTRKDPHYDLKNHPDLVRRLHINPTGENRLAYLHIRPGQIEAVREYIARTWPNQFEILESSYAVDNGLFGSGNPHAAIGDRSGDLILVTRGDAYLWWGSQENPIIGRHGGLSPEEMLVPFLAARL